MTSISSVVILTIEDLAAVVCPFKYTISTKSTRQTSANKIIQKATIKVKKKPEQNQNFLLYKQHISHSYGHEGVTQFIRLAPNMPA